MIITPTTSSIRFSASFLSPSSLRPLLPHPACHKKHTNTTATSFKSFRTSQYSPTTSLHYRFYFAIGREIRREKRMASTTTNMPGAPGGGPANTQQPTTTTGIQRPPIGEELKLVNNLGNSRSPYVRAHKDNPVAWQEWGTEAIELARKHDRLIFLSVGYAACHWCHVMERESFSNPDIAKLLNEHFIPIKLDRESRPDLDRIYMNFVQATTGGGGWPLNVFLTPSLEPLFGGTYWPGPGSTTAHRDHVGFKDILRKMEGVWRAERGRCIESAREVSQQLREFAQEGLVSREGLKGDDGGDTLDLDLLDEAYDYFAGRYDEKLGGFGAAPKFPTPPNLVFMLSLGQYPAAVKDIVGEDDVIKAKEMVLKTLEAMWNGGIKDQIGNGFARYSVTRDWSLPHFEKMLYDQVQLLPLYLDAYLITRDSTFLDATLDIATYLTSSPIAASSGGFYSSEDADSLYRSGDKEKREGAFYVWTIREFIDILGERNGSIAAKYWDVTENGNVAPEFDAHDELMNQNVLNVKKTVESLAKESGITKEEFVKIIADSRAKLVAHREKERPRPALDDKIVLGWNGLAIGALARTASALEGLDAENYTDQIKSYLDAAEKTVTFIKKDMRDEKNGHLKRVWREGADEPDAFADDYAFLISGLIDLYTATWNDSYLQFADDLQKLQISLFWDTAAGGFFSTAENQPDLILRLKDGMDNAEPSTNGLSADNLFRLSSILSDDAYATQAKKTLQAFEAEVLEHPYLFVGLLKGVVFDRLGIKSTVISGSGLAVEKKVKEIKEQSSTAGTLARIGGGAKSEWLRGRSELLKAMDPEKNAVQYCENGACRDVALIDDSKKDVAETTTGGEKVVS